MSSHADAEAFISTMPRGVASVARRVHAEFVEQGCASYVKTIYIGYEIEGEMVAALYGRADHIELALALPEDADHPLLIDAAHLTWRTLPVAAVLRNAADARSLKPLALAACERVRLRSHDVKRDNEFFMRSRRERNRSR